ncbi:glycoside hydrolase family 6 protein [Dactylosporangium sp. NPDC049525]|uniref:glycoside hydrolase family 6 protein n=1 Tax=Dactylosporangium sp. NPDC049525 TaxID=3154730 RepID=UPI00341504B3
MRTPRRWRRPAVAAIVAVTLGTAGLWLAGGGSASAGTIAGTFYRDPGSQVLRWLAANPGDSRAALIRDRIGVQPQARWFTTPNTATTTASVQSYVGAANTAGQIPVLVAYAIPNRDCGGASAGGTTTLTEYAAWVRAFAAGLGTRTAVVLLEPDSLALQTCLDSAGVAARDAALASAVTTIKQANPSAKVYLDAGHSAWNSAGDQAGRLVAAGVRNADGFYSNVSNFRTTADEVAYGRNILNAIGAGNLHQIVDTSRNGRGPNGSQWCDPAGRGVGVGPTTSTGEASVDAFVWVKLPGEADGCAAAAGQFVPDLAYQLALNGVVPSTPPTSQSPSASPSASPSKSPSSSPSSSPSKSPSSSPPASQGSTGCSVAYRVDNQWNNGFTATLTITNRGPGTVNGWTLTFAFAGDQRISNAWNATASQSGTAVTVRDGGWNGTVPVGGTASFGFQAGYSGTNATPAAFKLNGTTCT